MARPVVHVLAPTLVAIVVGGLASRVGAAQVHSGPYGYHVTLPDEWTQIPEADVRAMAAAAVVGGIIGGLVGVVSYGWSRLKKKHGPAA